MTADLYLSLAQISRRITPANPNFHSSPCKNLIRLSNCPLTITGKMTPLAVVLFPTNLKLLFSYEVCCIF